MACRLSCAKNVAVICLFCTAWVMGMEPVASLYGASEKQGKAAPLFTFVQASDPHVVAGKSVDSIRKAVDDINLLDPQPKFVIVTGDLIDGEKARASTDLYKSEFSRLRCPWRSVYGNHDDRNEFKRVCGEFNYSFDLAPYHFIVLDNIETDVKDTFNGKFSDRTVAWLREHLRSVNPKTPIILFCHATIYREGSYSKMLPGDSHNYEPVLESLKPYKVIAWFAGHSHVNAHMRKGGIDYFTTAGVSDARRNRPASGYRIVSVYPDHVETVYRTAAEYGLPDRGALRQQRTFLANYGAFFRESPLVSVVECDRLEACPTWVHTAWAANPTRK